MRGHYEVDPIEEALRGLRRRARQYAGAYLEDINVEVMNGAERDLIAAAFSYVLAVQASEKPKPKDRSPRATDTRKGK